ncbi:amino acid adenylation domain-containing protein [Paracoccus caeni]|uniref:Amino acid adenylation domain-containing protein n=1 Tax=Paracoccus caeni TaxID=657651 RepID=A0A934VZL9_9RHOB|nr:non-ribosomal peptide synthetase [Paracoccus caeni]MBK4215970.1 amino acid adenylation domain-containing protein [Paracoccus caeni]
MEDRIAALRARVAGLSPAEQQAFRLKIEAAGIDWARVAPAAVALRPARLPLSPGQMHFWLGQQVQPDSAAFAIAFAWGIDGPLDPEALSRALAHLVARHEPLRTAFPSEDGQPWQDIREVAITLTRLDVASDTDAAKAERSFAARPFDLAEAPLFRATLLRFAPDRHRLLLSFHHIIADGWSRGVFLRELAEIYRAFVAGVRPDLPNLPRQFGDLVLEQQHWLTSSEAVRQEDFWRGELAGIEPLELPGSARAGEGAGTVLTDLDPVLSQRVVAEAARLGVTPFVLLLAVFQLLQHRLTGADDVAVGTPVAGRATPESGALIGLFLNTLVLRGRPVAGTSFRDLLEQTRQGFVRAFDHQDLPFARVVEAVGAERQVGRNPLFQVLFQVQSGYGAQNADRLDLGDPRLTVRQEVIPLPDAKFDLSWHMMQRDTGLSIIAEYRRELFEEARIRDMIGQFGRLLTLALDRPDAPIETLDYVADPVVLQGPSAPIPDLLAMIDAAAERSSLIIAATGEAISGAELLNRASALARRLCARPELAGGAPLAICLPRGAEMVVALLAALKAGIAYVPLDPAHPAQRRDAILSDAGAGLMLAREMQANCPVLDPADLDGAPEADLPAADPDRIAYVIFTSGSTGRPKGVPVSHAALSNLIASMADLPGMGQGDRLLALTTIAFDIAALEIFLPLAVGGTLILADDQTAAAPEALADALNRHAVTHLQATPATWRLLIDSGWQGNPTLTALTGGEALPSDLGRALLNRTGALWNMYGPTETTIWSAARRLSQDDLSGPQALIGGPVRNTALLVVDRYGAPLPAGLPGELAISGAGLSPGYWQRPDLTADRFVTRDGQRLYLTGDRVRIEADGALSFLGRLDHQIKLNGYRIEPGEIEAALRADPAIAEALIIADAGRLIAYCRAEAAAPTPEQLRATLASTVPAYMIPAVFVMLDAFPLNANGKIDRARLPRPDAPVLTSRAPETDAERELLAIWSEVLGRDDIGVEDNFFAIGGASVSAMQIASRARGKGLTLTPAQMFEHQTIATQAAVAGQRAAARVLPLSPWQWATQDSAQEWRSLTLPLQAADGDLPNIIAQLERMHPVLRYNLTPDGWQSDGETRLWQARIDAGELTLTAHPLLLDRPSLARLAELIAGSAPDSPIQPKASYADWLDQKTTFPQPEFLPLTVDVPDAPTEIALHLGPADLRRLRANAQAANAAPSRLAAAALARALSPWATSGFTLALIEDAPADALGHFTRALPLHLGQPAQDAAASLRQIAEAEAACDPRGCDPLLLPDGVALLSWDQPPPDLPTRPALSVEIQPEGDGLRLTFRSDAQSFRAATVQRLAGRMISELTAPIAAAASGKLDRLRAKLTEARG